MTISAFDVDSYNKPGFDFGIAYAEGYRAGYIKLGGDNLNPRYCGSGYQAQFDAFAAQPFEHRGCYWVTGGSDPVASAQFYLAHRDPRTTFDVLDNETLDDGWSWSDDEACAFFDVLIAAGLTDLWQYGSRDSLWNQHEWPGLEARGIKAIVAIYNDAPFQNIYPATYPAALVKGHQFTSSATIGGLGAIDENAFTDDAFTGAQTTTEEENDMNDYLCVENSQDGMIGKGQRFVQGADGVLRCLPNGEWEVRSHNFPSIKPAEWSGDRISSAIKYVGLREYTYDRGTPGGVGRLTGKIIYSATEPRVFPKMTVAD